VTMKDAGPRAESWMTLARISANSEVVPINLVQCECPMKKSLIQLWMSSHSDRLAIFSIRVVCLTVSNALLKSSANTQTKGCTDNNVKIVWSRVISAASVEPVGLNAI